MDSFEWALREVGQGFIIAGTVFVARIIRGAVSERPSLIQRGWIAMQLAFLAAGSSVGLINFEMRPESVEWMPVILTMLALGSLSVWLLKPIKVRSVQGEGS